MLDESLGRSERRATAIVLVVLGVETIWAFLHRYFSLDASMWTLHIDLMHRHLAGIRGDGWKVIPYPAANTLIPLVSSLAAFFLNSEVVARLLIALVGIFGRGAAALIVMRVLRVRDEGVYYLIPVFVFSGLWFSGALPFMAGEMFALLTLAMLLAQYQPRSRAYWMLTAGFTMTALCSGLAFIVALLAIFFVTNEQRRSVHLSQGWLSSPRAVFGLALPGIAVCILSAFARAPLFALSTSGLLPQNGVGFLFFCATPVPAVLEAMLRGTSVFQIVIAASVWIIVFGFAARALLLAIEEVTWQSRTLKSTAVMLIVLAIAGIWISVLRLDTPALFGTAVILLMAGSYSRGPAVRRTMLDRVLLTCSVVAMVVTGLFNAFAINRGSDAATDVVHRSRALVQEARRNAQSDEHLDSLHIAVVLDSALAQANAADVIATFSYSYSAPLYLLQESDQLGDARAMQPLNGGMQWAPDPARMLPLQPMSRTSATAPIVFASITDYTHPAFRVLTSLTTGTSRTSSFGPEQFHIADTLGTTFAFGAAQFRLLEGHLSAAEATGLASR